MSQGGRSQAREGEPEPVHGLAPSGPFEEYADDQDEESDESNRPPEAVRREQHRGEPGAVPGRAGSRAARWTWRGPGHRPRSPDAGAARASHQFDATPARPAGCRESAPHRAGTLPERPSRRRRVSVRRPRSSSRCGRRRRRTRPQSGGGHRSTTSATRRGRQQPRGGASKETTIFAGSSVSVASRVTRWRPVIAHGVPGVVDHRDAGCPDDDVLAEGELEPCRSRLQTGAVNRVARHQVGVRFRGRGHQTEEHDRAGQQQRSQAPGGARITAPACAAA